MVTYAGKQTDLTEGIQAIIELEYDASESYISAISRLENTSYQSTLEEFLKDHQRHIKELTEYLHRQGHTAPSGPSFKSFISQTKVIIANMVGDRAILMAMRSNEDDTNLAYERMTAREDLTLDLRSLVVASLKDERRHRDWLDITLKGESSKKAS
jgi:rubrerythrin